MERNKHISDKFNQLEAPIDKEGLWDKIAEDDRFPASPIIPLHKKIILWLGFGSIVILLAFLIFSQSMSGFNPNQKVSKIESFAIEENTNNQSILSPLNDENSVKVEQSITELQSESSDKIRSLVKKESSLNKITNKAINDNIKKETKLIALQDYGDQLEFSSPLNRKVNKSSLRTHKKTINEGIISSISDNDKRDKTIIEKTNEIKSQALVSSDNTSQSLPQDRSLPNINHLSRTQLLDYPNDFPNSLNISTIKQRKDLWTIYASYLIGLSIHKVDGNRGAGDDYLDARKQGITNLESSGIIIGVKRKIARNFSLGIELEQSGVYQRLTNTQETTNYVRVENSEFGFHAKEVHTTTWLFHHTYRFTRLNILLDKSYRINRSLFLLAIGASFDMNYQANGKYMLDFQSIKKIEDLEIYETSKNVHGLAQLSYGYVLTPKLILKLVARYDLPYNIGNGTTNFSHMLSSYRLGMGLTYSF